MTRNITTISTYYAAQVQAVEKRGGERNRILYV
jgi:hypothetical protein